VFFIYRQAFQFGQMGYAAAVSVVLFVVSIVLAAVVFRWARGWVYYESVR
jgi:oligogalacturonide transport system permease protein